MNLSELEEKLERLIEVHLISALPGQKPEDFIVQKLTSALESSTIIQSDGTRVAPNVFTFLVHTSNLDHWKDPLILETLNEVLTSIGQTTHTHFSGMPEITIASDLNMTPGNFDVIASHTMGILEETKDMLADTPVSLETEQAGELPESAFLIVEGAKVVPLKQAVINIGRRLDNTLIVDDPRVSRNHAQLRAIRGRFVLFDLNSSGGTFVNGKRADQTVLYPGDVISLAGVSLIFNQDSKLLPPNLEDTSPGGVDGTDAPRVLKKALPSKSKRNK